MANPVYEVLLTQEPLSAPHHNVDPAAGAVVDFWGNVRGLEDGREIEGIDYEAHAEMARHQMEKIARQAAADFGLNALMLHHRIGFVAAGESSLFLRVCAPHRAKAFEASKWIVDELKKKVPIWKKPGLRQGYGAASAETQTSVVSQT